MDENKNKKRILHVLHVVYDILSALFIIFVSSALIINAVTRGDNQKQDILTPNVQEVRSKRDIYVGSGRNICMSSDFLSPSFIIPIINASSILDEYNNHNNRYARIYVGEGYDPNNPGHPSYPRVTRWDNINYNDFTANGEEDTNWYYLNSIQLDVTWSTYVSASDLHIYDITLYFQNDLEDNIFHFSVELFVFGQYLFESNYTLNLTSSVSVDAYGLYYNFAVIYTKGRSLDTWLSVMSNGTFEQGYNIGKEQGYYEGVVDGANGIQTNAFTVIGQAFGAVANIFSIEVLPGFPLWVLVFTPLIIAVVIVVVKMIKG